MDFRKKFFTQRVVMHWNRLPKEVVEAFKARLDVALGSLFQCITTTWVKNFLLISNLNLPCLILQPFPLVLSLPTLINSRSPSCLYAPFKHWKATMRSPRSLLFSKLNKPSSLSLSS